MLMHQKGAAWHTHQLCFLLLLVPRMEKHLSPKWFSKNLPLLVHPIFLKGCKLLSRKKSAFSWEGLLETYREEMMLGFCFPQQHCQGSSQYCNNYCGRKGFFYFFPEQTVVQDPYNVIQRLLNTIKVMKLQTKRRVQREFMYLLGQMMVLGSETKHITLRYYCEKKDNQSFLKTNTGLYVHIQIHIFTHPPNIYTYTR